MAMQSEFLSWMCTRCLVLCREDLAQLPCTHTAAMLCDDAVIHAMKDGDRPSFRQSLSERLAILLRCYGLSCLTTCKIDRHTEQCGLPGRLYRQLFLLVPLIAGCQAYSSHESRIHGGPS